MVAELRVLQNTTGTEECERQAVKAARLPFGNRQSLTDGR